MDLKKFSIITLVFTTFFWGTTFVFVAKTIQIIPLDGFLTIRFGLASFILLLFVLTDKEAREDIFDAKLILYGFILGMLLYFSFWFQTEGLLYTTPAKAAFITGFNVILVPIVGIYPFRNKINNYEWIAVIIAIFGLSLMSLDFKELTSFNKGDLLILVTAICIAYHILITNKVDDLNPKSLVFVQLLTVTISSFTVSIFRSSIWVPNFNEPLIVWITIVLTSLLATAFAFIAQTYAQNYGVKSTHVALIFSLEPIFALFVDILLNILPTLTAILGMMLMFISMIIIAIKGD